LYFYTDVFGISAAAAGTLIFVARFVDAFTDPLMGLIMDRTRSRWGRMRPYLLFGGIPMGVALVLVFSVPDLSEGAKLVWAYATYILFGITFTIVGVPYSALTALMTDDYEERTRLSTIRMGCAFTGGLLVSAGTFWLVGFSSDVAVGFRNTMVFYAVLATLMLWVAFVSTSRVVAREAEYAATGSTISGWRDIDLRPILHNSHLWVVIGIFCCGMMSFTVRSAATPYYFKYYVGRPDLIPVFFLVTLSAMLIGLLAVPRLTAALGKTRALYVGAAITVVGCSGFYFLSPESLVAIFFFGCLISLGGTPVAVLGWSLLPDTVDYAQWRHGVRADGLVYSTASFFQKLAKMLGGSGVALMLALSGFVANLDQNEASLVAIVGLMTWIPILIMVPLIGFAMLHRLDEPTHRSIIVDLAKTKL
jgi:sugar (glycoside-pentoside-hexuronide) transporter